MLVDTILDKMGGDVLLLDIRDEVIFTDYFLICNGENDRQLKALAESIADDAKIQRLGVIRLRRVDRAPF